MIGPVHIGVALLSIPGTGCIDTGAGSLVGILGVGGAGLAAFLWQRGKTKRETQRANAAKDSADRTRVVAKEERGARDEADEAKQASRDKLKAELDRIAARPKPASDKDLFDLAKSGKARRE